MLSSINWLRQLIARDKAKQPQLKNQLPHKSSLPTIGRDKAEVNYAITEQELLALVQALLAWRCYLEMCTEKELLLAHPFGVFTNAKNAV